MIAIALALAGAGMWLVQRQVSQKEKQARKAAEVEVQGQLVDALFAKAEIQAQTELKPEMFIVRKTPKRFLPPDAVTNIADVGGMFSKLPFLAEELVRSSKITTKDQLATLSVRIPAGRRAMAVGINPVNAVGYSIGPGDRVDVIVLLSTRNRDRFSRTVLQDIEVLETTMSRMTDQKKPSGVMTATLALSPQEAEAMALAASAGEISLSLRAFSDRDIVASSGTTLSKLVAGGAVTPPPGGGTGSRMIEIYYGNKKVDAAVGGPPPIVPATDKEGEGESATKSGGDEGPSSDEQLSDEQEVTPQ